MVYLPHLYYDHQRFGPGAPESAAAARELDGVAGELADAGLLNVYTQAGMEYLDPWTSRAFAVADDQLAHVDVRDPADIGAARAALAGLGGIDLVLAGDERRQAGLDDDRAPDFARQVEIHRKPGYDPAELFMDPATGS
jgi:hypothetical protein